MRYPPKARRSFRACSFALIACVSLAVAASAQTYPVFHPYRPSGPHGHRDIEFQWSDSYRIARGGGAPITPAEARTMDRLAQTMCEDYSNPIGSQMSDVELVFNYFFPFGDVYDRNPASPVGIREAWLYGAGYSVQPLAGDTTHIDVYIYAPGDLDQGGYSYTVGMCPSAYSSATEDTSTGHAADPADIFHWNSIMVPGPYPSQSIDTTGTGWTIGDRGVNAAALHEYAHSFNQLMLIDGQGRMITFMAGAGTNELFSSAAEQLVGQKDSPTAWGTFEVPYTWPLLVVNRNKTTDGCLDTWTPSVNYQNWRSFAAYLLYNFRGADTTGTLQGLRDDLFYRWTHATPTAFVAFGSTDTSLFYNRTMPYLGTILADSSCLTCAGRSYFHPGGQSLPPNDRLGLLLHNWRTASYVNSSTLAEGQYGFPPQFGFSPASNLLAWHSVDGCSPDDAISVPPNVVMSRTGANRQRLFSHFRSGALSGGGSTTYPMAIYHTGAEYWTVRADASLANNGPHSLVVKVGADSTWRRRYVRNANLPDSLVREGELRLVASVVGYTTAGLTDSLWRHPEWATYAAAPQWVDLDSLERNISLTLPNFGTTYKAALVVVTVATGRHGDPNFDPVDNWYENSTKWVPYRVAFAVSDGSTLPSEPTIVASEATASESAPSWSPSNADVAYVRTASGGVPQVYRKPIVGGTATAVFATAEEQHDPDWSPRGDVIVFARGNTTAYSPATELWLAALNGTASAITNDGGWKRSPVFNHNGRTIAYAARFTYAMPQGGQEQRWGIWTIGVDGSARTQVVQSAFGNPITTVRWSPDGTSIWFNSADSIYVVTPSTGAVVNRTGRLPVGVQSFDHPRSGGPIAIEQPGSKLWFYRGSLKLAENYRRIALQDTTLADSDPFLYQRGNAFYSPRWSIDGTKVAYASGPLGGDLNVSVGTARTNHAPAMTAGSYADSDQLATCSLFQRTLSATDADGDAVTYELLHKPGGMSIAGGNLLKWIPNSSQVGDWYVTLRAKDGNGGVDQKVMHFFVGDYPEICSCPRYPYCYPAGAQPVTENSDIPVAFGLSQNQPNPFHDPTTIRFALPSSSHVRLEIFDLLGRRVRTLVDADLPAAFHSRQWDLRTDHGDLVRPGIYMYRMVAGDFRDQKKMLLVP